MVGQPESVQPPRTARPRWALLRLGLRPRLRGAHREGKLWIDTCQAAPWVLDTAAGLCAEVGSFERFAKPALLSGFLGIVPCEYTSDQKRVQGQITKAGPTHARRLLVEAAHHYRRRPRVSAELCARHNGQDPRVVAIAWRAQRRLHQRWAHLGQARGKPTGTVAIACARELAAFCWEAATLD